MQQNESEFKVIYDHLNGKALTDDSTLSERKMQVYMNLQSMVMVYYFALMCPIVELGQELELECVFVHQNPFVINY